jgi:hypothetical protein
VTPKKPPSLRLPPAQERAALLLAEGESQAGVARILHKTPGTLTRWMKKPHFRDRIEELRTDLTKQAVERLQETVVDNTEIILDIAKNGGTPGVVSSQLRAALWAVERILKPNVGRSEPDQSKALRSVAAEVERLPDDEVDEYLQRGTE